MGEMQLPLVKTGGQRSLRSLNLSTGWNYKPLLRLDKFLQIKNCSLLCLNYNEREVLQ